MFTVKNKKKQKNNNPDVGLILPACFYSTRPARNAQQRIACQLAGMIIVLCWAAAVMANDKVKAESPNKTYHFDIPALIVHDALNRVAKQTGNQLFVSSELAETLTSSPVQGQYTVSGALAVLLKGTHLSGSLTEHGVIVIRYPKPDPKTNGDETVNTLNTKKTILASTIAFFVGGSGVNAAEVAVEDGRIYALEEVVVTATKRETSLQNTAMAITAVDSELIDKKNLVSMDDYLRNIPGVSMQDRGAGQNSIVIRGMATNPQFDDSTAGSYFGEIPISNIGSASQSGNAGNADLKLIDIERVEVLRGPQGTLYGSGSMAGTVRVVPNAPKLDSQEGRIATRISNTAEAGGDNYSVQGTFSTPLVEDKLAVRAVVYHIDNSGYIDNVAASEPTERITNFVENDGVVVKDEGDRGNNETTGLRLAALWQVTDQLDATFSYIEQDIEQDGWPEVELDVGTYKQARWQIGVGQDESEFIEEELELANILLNYDMGWAGLTSSTSWVDNSAAIGMNSSSTAHYRNNTASTDLFIQEIRLSSQWDGPFQLVTGLYYEDAERELHTLWLWSGDPALDPYPPTGLPKTTFDRVTTVEQKALFGELTYQFSEQWEATLGLRHFDYEQEEVASFLFNATPRYEDRVRSTDESDQIFKGAISYAANEDVLIYGQWAQGFRLGKGQGQPIECTNAGIEVGGIDSDRSDSLELGVKSSWSDGRVILNSAVYSTDWEDIPVFFRDEFDCARTVNAGKANSTGVEIELRALLTDSLVLDLSASTVDATLEDDSSIGEKGDDLPASADYNANIGIEYGFELGGYRSFARLDYAYVGEYYNNVQETGTPAGGFSQIHLKAGSTIGQFDVDLFVDNVANDDGFTWVEDNFTRFSGTSPAYRIRPRTIGVNLSYSF